MARPRISKNPNYRKMTCPWCGEPVWRYRLKKEEPMVRGPSDPRAGSAHSHRCHVDNQKLGYVLYTDPERKKRLYDDWEQRWPREGR